MKFLSCPINHLFCQAHVFLQEAADQNLIIKFSVRSQVNERLELLCKLAMPCLSSGFWLKRYDCSASGSCLCYPLVELLCKLAISRLSSGVCFKDAHCNNCWIVIPILFKMCLNMVYTGLCVIMHTIDECVLCLDTWIEIQDTFYFLSVLKIYCVTSTNF